MAILRDWCRGDDEPCDRDAEPLARDYRSATNDYLAAREALKRIRPDMDPLAVFAIQDRFYRAQTALLALNDGRRWDAERRA